MVRRRDGRKAGAETRSGSAPAEMKLPQHVRLQLVAPATLSPVGPQVCAHGLVLPILPVPPPRPLVDDIPHLPRGIDDQRAPAVEVEQLPRATHGAGLSHL